MKPLSETIAKAKHASTHLRLAERKAGEADKELNETLKEAEQKISKITLKKIQAARLAGCDPSTLWRHKKQGKLKSLLITDVLEWIEEYRPGRTDETQL